MKSKKTFVSLIASSLLLTLVSCGAEAKPTTSFGKFVKLISDERNCTVSVNDSKIEFYSDKAMLKKWEGESFTSYFPDQGHLINKNQGVYSYYVSGEDIIIGNVESANSKVSVFDVVTSPLTFLKEDLWSMVEGDEFTYTTTNKTVYNYLTDISGYGQYAEYVKSATLEFDQLEPTEAAITVSFDFGGVQKPFSDVIVINNIGKTENEIVEAYLAWPTEQKGVSYPYSEATEAYMNNFSGEVMPEFKGITYASKIANDSARSQWKITDYKSGDISKDATEALTKKGWAMDEEKSRKEQGYSNYVLSKSAVVDGIRTVYNVTINYVSGEWLADTNSNTFYEDYYNHGIFTITGTKTEYRTFENMKQYYGDYLTEELGLSNPLPDFGFTAEPTNITYEDRRDSIFADTGAIYPTYSVFHGNFSSKDVAEANFKKYQSNIERYGFQFYESSGYYQMYMDFLIVGINWKIEDDGAFELKVIAVPYYE
ncbi:MAG: hypothetical protein MJ220_01940 [Bacilli bacterium]|nr:hypothetical protein [Bacilli bacterium]